MGSSSRSSISRVLDDLSSSAVVCLDVFNQEILRWFPCCWRAAFFCITECPGPLRADLMSLMDLDEMKMKMKMKFWRMKACLIEVSGQWGLDVLCCSVFQRHSAHHIHYGFHVYHVY
ncbi:hypothetical protein DsansV1_C19g0159881 [Dioscorea sansibarensis]